jgi:bacteriocin-like protein
MDKNISLREGWRTHNEGSDTNMFTKKNTRVEEQVMQEMTDEQLSQITGGSLTGTGMGVLGAVTSTATGLLGSVSLGGMQAEAAGVGCYTPAVSTSGLVSDLL